MLMRNSGDGGRARQTGGDDKAAHRAIIFVGYDPLFAQIHADPLGFVDGHLNRRQTIELAGQEGRGAAFDVVGKGALDHRADLGRDALQRRLLHRSRQRCGDGERGHQRAGRCRVLIRRVRRGGVFGGGRSCPQHSRAGQGADQHPSFPDSDFPSHRTFISSVCMHSALCQRRVLCIIEGSWPMLARLLCPTALLKLPPAAYTS